MVIPKKIAFITSYAPSLIDFKGPLFHDLITSGHSVFVFAPDISDSVRNKLRRIGVVPFSLSFSRSASLVADIRVLLLLTLKLRQLSIDICVTSFLKPNTFGVFAAKLAFVGRVVTLIEGLGFFYTSRPEKNTFLFWLQRFLVSCLYRISLRLATRNVFLNIDDMHLFTSSLISPHKYSSVVSGTGIDTRLWPCLPPVISSISFIFVGRLLVDKGIREFLRAALMIHHLFPSVSFYVLGDFDDNPKSLSKDDPLVTKSSSFVNFIGHSDVKYWLSKSSVFVLPSYREGLPRSTQEALSSGKPIITSDVAGCRETVIDSFNGYLIPPFSSRHLASSMIKFIYDPSLIISMGQNSRLIASQFYDSSIINPALISKIIGD